MAKSEKQFDDELKKIIKEDKPLKAPKVTKQTKQKENNMKQFIKKPITIVVLTVALTLAAVYASYSGYQAIYNQGYNDAKSEQAKVDALIAELKENQ